MISGPASLTIYHIDEKSYFLFGDIHGGNSKQCDAFGHECDYYDVVSNTYHYKSDQCTDLVTLFHYWFTFNNDHGIVTNFYSENPYTKDIKRELKPGFVDIVKHDSQLAIMQLSYFNCYTTNKKDCPYYPNVHFHYADVRSFHKITPDEFYLNRFSPFKLEPILMYRKQDNNSAINYDIALWIKYLFVNYKQLLAYIFDPYGLPP